MDCCEEVPCGLIITCGDRTELLEFGEEVLDQMPCRIHVAIEFSGLLLVCLRRDDRGPPVAVRQPQPDRGPRHRSDGSQSDCRGRQPGYGSWCSIRGATARSPGRHRLFLSAGTVL